jgi:hypothetical protein
MEKRKLSGWQKIGIVAGIGCASIIGLVVIAVVVSVLWARSTLSQYGDPTPQRVEKTVALPPPATAPDANRKGADGAVNDRRRLTLDLQEGSFSIHPAPAGSSVQVEGNYAPGFYDLTERTETDSGGAQHTTIRFRGKAPGWARFLGGMFGGSRDQPEVTIGIPSGTPIDLALRVGMGQSRIDLGGLTLGDLGLDLNMGDHKVDFTSPLGERLERLVLKTSMGNVEVNNLGNARAKAVQAEGSMGNLEADLGGAWQSGSEAELTFTQSMGQVSVRVPRQVRLEANITSPNDSQNRVTGAEEAADPKAPLLRVRVSASMGEGRVRRY